MRAGRPRRLAARGAAAAAAASAAALALAYVAAASAADSAALLYLGAHRNGVGGVEGLHRARDVAVSPDGASVYVAGLSDDAVAVFARGGDGALAYVEVHRDGVGGVEGLGGACSVAVSPDGANVYVTGLSDDAISVFARSATTGELSFLEAHRNGIGGVEGLDGARGVAVSPTDGASVYVIGRDDDALAAFTRSAATGKLTYLEVHRNGVAGVEGLDGVRGVAMSPDGASVYVASLFGDALAVFGRSAATGELTHLEVHRDGIGGVEGLVGACSVAVSPDGANVYVAGLYGDALAAFERSAATGELTFLEAHRNNVGGVEGLGGARGVAVSPDGASVYVAGDTDSALAVFERSAATGGLTFLEVHRNNVGGVEGLDGARGVAVSPDGTSVYVAGFEDDAVAAFARAGMPPRAAPPSAQARDAPGGDDDGDDDGVGATSAGARGPSAAGAASLAVAAALAAHSPLLRPPNELARALGT